MSTPATTEKQTKADFESDQDVRWCPGCGDYSILATMQRFMPSLGLPREKYVFVSGIGCSSRFPYYMNTYGFHTIHGRAPAIASGIKLTNPDLSVWMVTGDGDALSIGGNHFIHLLRRNIDINVLLFNNRIYGLTKGQYSPTSELGKITKSTPQGSADFPLNPILLALGAQATFIARTIDVDAPHMLEVLAAAAVHKGTSFIEIYQNCNIFNDGAFDAVRERDTRAEVQLKLVHGKPLLFGKTNPRGIRVTAQGPEIVSATEENWESAGVTVYDSHSTSMANAVAQLGAKAEDPVPVGIFFQQTRPTLEMAMSTQRQQAVTKRPLSADIDQNLRALFNSGDTWSVTS